jgi:uncharacterized protein YcbK (DUF882 family)
VGDLSEHFSRSEFRCRCGCGLAGINQALIQRLEHARRILGKPIRITSGVRCASHNVTEGGAETSAHLTGLAADIACPSNYERYDLLMALLTVSFARIGIGKDFLHVDIDRTKAHDICWLY